MATCQRCGAELPLPHPNRGGPRKWCSENCRKRASDDRNRAMCTECRAPLGPRSGWAGSKPSLRCLKCERAAKAASRRERIERVAEMWKAGMTTREIADALGYGPNSVPPEVTAARRLGLRLPQRCIRAPLRLLERTKGRPSGGGSRTKPRAAPPFMR